MQRKNNFIEKLVSSKIFWTVFCLMAFSYPLVRAVNRELPEPLPVYSKLPAFDFVTEDNHSIKLKDLEGRVVLMNFIFASCPTVCPKNLEKMQKIQKRVRGLGTKVTILSFTVDPDNDTPKVLFKLARDRGANPFIWKFITGKKESLKEFLIDGLKVPMGDKEETNNIYDIAHSEKIVLVDQVGNIRGYYGMSKDNINKLMIDVGLLANNAFKTE